MGSAETIAKRLYCPGCGRRFIGADLKLVGAGVDELDLYLRCSGCGLYLQLTVAERDPSVGVAAVAAVRQGFEPVEEQPEPPVTAEDVAEIRQFLSSFYGDIRRLLDSPSDGP